MIVASSLALVVMLAGYLGGACLALTAPTDRWARRVTALGASIGSLGALWLGLRVLITGVPLEVLVPNLVSVAGGFVLRLDLLGAFFLAVVGIVSLPAAIYGAVYTAAYDGQYSLRFFGLMFNMFLLGMTLVPCAGNVLTFVLAWELMAVASYFLVITESDQSDTRHAGLWYIGMTHFGLVLLLPIFFLMAPGPERTTFWDLQVGAANLSPSVRDAVFLLAVVAFGSKAGIVPLHVWLPRAHPAAPSHVSALMSGVMIKLGIYGLLRVSLDLLGGGPAWWGGLLLAIGSVSALLGVLYALMEHDLKRLLAYHSVENIGIIVIGVGAGLILHSYRLYPLAAVGFVAALFHTLNHACFKALLFLGAGNVLHQAHTRNMEELGGLIKRMPQTAMLFLVGSAAIAALPPLNGFASEWMVFQALLAGTQIPRPEVAIGMPLAIGMLALTSGLAAACFVKAFGITFLAIPRSEHAARASESHWSMRLPMSLLALACIVFGVGASLLVPSLYHVLNAVDGLTGQSMPALSAGLSIETAMGFGRVSPALIALVLAVTILITLVVKRLSERRPERIAETWGCGRIRQSPRMEYTASAFAEPLRRVFTELYRPTEDLTISAHPASRYFVQSITYRTGIEPWFEKAIYDPLTRAVRFAATNVRRLQAGSVHLYLVYVVVALLGVLASVWWVR